MTHPRVDGINAGHGILAVLYAFTSCSQAFTSHCGELSCSPIRLEQSRRSFLRCPVVNVIGEPLHVARCGPSARQFRVDLACARALLRFQEDACRQD